MIMSSSSTSKNCNVVFGNTYCYVVSDKVSMDSKESEESRGVSPLIFLSVIITM